MNKQRTIFETPDKVFRILEIEDQTFSLEDLKGDCFKPEVSPEIDPKVLKIEEARFERLVEEEGVFGYVLEIWDQRPGQGYVEADSCWGFVGSYREDLNDFKHEIVTEFRAEIQRRTV